MALSVRRSGHLSYKVIYRLHGRLRWYHLGDHKDIGLKAARELARKVMIQVHEGKDPQAERKAQRGFGTFEELASRYVEEYAKGKNKSWKQPEALVKKHLLPRWGKLKAHTISRDDVKLAIAQIKAPIVANQTLAAASAIFSWAIKELVGGVKDNPCKLIDRNPTKSRERVLSDSEVPKFWSEFDSADLVRGAALKMILLMGQRPVRFVICATSTSLRWLVGIPGRRGENAGCVGACLDWPGTKNMQSHRVWLSAPAHDLITQVNGGDEVKSGFVFSTSHGRPVLPRSMIAMKMICGEARSRTGDTARSETHPRHQDNGPRLRS